ncbi:MAG: TlpA disulfide reductase family protein, partial [Elusimicrobiota bacterium]
ASTSSAGLPKRFAWTLPSADGGAPVKLSKFKGKVVLLEFWTTVCGPCHEAKPFFEELQRRFGERGVIILSIDNAESPEVVKKYLAAHPSQLKVLLDPEGVVEKALGLYGQPAMALFDTNEQLNWSAVGFEKTTKDELAARIDRMAPGARGSVPVGARPRRLVDRPD